MNTDSITTNLLNKLSDREFNALVAQILGWHIIEKRRTFKNFTIYNEWQVVSPTGLHFTCHVIDKYIEGQFFEIISDWCNDLNMAWELSDDFYLKKIAYAGGAVSNKAELGGYEALHSSPARAIATVWVLYKLGELEYERGTLYWNV